MNVGVSTLVEFLHKKGFADVTEDLNQKLTDEEYNLLVAEYSQDKSIREEANRFLQDRISRKAVPEEPLQEEKPAKPAKKEPEMIETVIPEEPVIKFKTVGKINLETPKPEPKEEPKEEPAPRKETVKPAPQPKQQSSEPEKEAEKPAEPVKKEPEVKPEPKPVVTPKPEPVKAEPKPVKVEPEVKAAPKEEPVKAETPKEEVFKIQAPQNGGLNIRTVGKIDLEAINQSTRPKKKSKEEKKKEREAKEQQRQQQRQQFKESLMKEIKPGDRNQDGDVPRKKNRVRIGGEKVDLTKADSYSQSQNNSDNRGKDAQKGGGRNNKDHRFNKADKADFSNEDVNRQIRDTFSSFQKGKTKSSKYRKDKREQVQQRQMEALEQEMAESKVLKLTEFVTANELATMMNIPVTQVIATCMNVGMMVSINQRLDAETINIVADEYGFTTDFVSAEVAQQISEEKDKEEDLVPRAPIVTVMGHVDHGKTSLLDYIRKSKVAVGEAGGITQRIGAYHVETRNSGITFLDTPGHAAFTAMRARGAQCTDIVVLVVAADDGVMPQTLEAIQHAQAGKVPMIVAINKMDKPGADPQRVINELMQHSVIPEEMGGENQFVQVSAKTGMGVDDLLEAITLQAEVLELKAVHDGMAEGVTIESRLDKGRGPVATVLVRSGTLHKGDTILCGLQYGRVRAMRNEKGQELNEAGPSIPVEVFGLSGVPSAGDEVTAVSDEKKAREVALFRQGKFRELKIAKQKSAQLASMFSENNASELKVVLKADTQGSVEAISDALIKLGNEEVQVKIIGSGVGGITANDATLAAADSAVVIGFNVRADGPARQVIDTESVDLHYYSVIYDLIDDVKKAMSGLLKKEVRENFIGYAEVRDVFRHPKFGAIAGCMVVEGMVKRSAPIRVLRDNTVIFEGELDSLRRFKDDVAEVKQNTECGICVKNYQDVRVGDRIEVFEKVEVARTLD